MKKCPFCAEEVQDEAVLCRYCHSDLRGTAADPALLQPGDRASPAPAAAPATAPAAQRVEPRVGEGATRFSHSGYRWILGYGPDFFGIWDRQQPGPAAMRFPRNDQGWSDAWNRFAALEPRAMEVPQTGTQVPPGGLAGGSFRDARAPSQWTVGLLAASAVLAVIGFIVDAAAVSTLQEARDRGFLTVSERHDLIGARAAVGFAASILVIATAVAWCIWQHRAHSNLRALGSADLRFSPGMAIAWWFIPLANIVMPFVAMRELWKASDPEAGAVDWKMVATPALLGFWWAAWLARSVLGVFERLGLGTQTPSRLITFSYLGMGGEACTFAAAILAIALIRRIRARQEAKRQRTAAWTSTATPPATTNTPSSSAPGA